MPMTLTLDKMGCASLLRESGEAGYQLIDHTADMGLTAWGSTSQEAFAQATRGMFAIILGVDPDTRLTQTKTLLEVAVVGEDWPQLLVNWLAELLFHFETQHFIPQHIHFEQCQPPRCTAKIYGTIVDDWDQIEGMEIKAVTYHQLQVIVEPQLTWLQVIFDI